MDKLTCGLIDIGKSVMQITIWFSVSKGDKEKKKRKKEKLDLPANMFQCNQCRYKAKQNGDISRHIKSIHKGVKFPCDLCDYKATQKGDLSRHLISRHKGKDKGNQEE